MKTKPRKDITGVKGKTREPSIESVTAGYEAWMRSCTNVLQSDLRSKHQQMKATPFGFLRGTFYRWAQLWPSVCKDLCGAPRVLAVGDLAVFGCGSLGIHFVQQLDVVESLFKFEPLISQVMLIGDRLPYLTALFTITTTVAETLKGMEQLQGRPAAELSAAPPVQKEIQKVVARINKQLAPFEQIRKYRVLGRDFSIEDGELTATMKVRRARVMENFRESIEELYAGKEM